jgi:DNA polymerase III subunit beta
MKVMMKEFFVIEQKPFLAILSSMQPICTRRTTIDATTCIYFHVEPRELIIKATDLEISLQTSYSFKESSISHPHTFLVSGKRLFDLVKEMHETITCILSGTQLLLQSGSVNLSLNIKDATEFPPFPERIENLMNFKSEDLLNMLSKVAFLIPQNNANPALNGLFLEINSKQCTMTTTDGHCLAQVAHTEYALPEEKKWLLPRRAIFEVKKILENTHDQQIFLGICKNQLVFSGETFNFFTKLLADQFPVYATVLDRTHFMPACVDRSQLVKTLRRSACLLSGQFIATKFEVNKDMIKVLMHNQDVGTLSEEIVVNNFEGPEMSVRFYAPYLLSGLQVLIDDSVQFFLNNPAKPIIFESSSSQLKFVYLVMPVAPNHG